MKQILILLLLATFAFLSAFSQGSGNEDYQNWKNTYGKNFTGNQDKYRSLIYTKNIDKINSHNSNPAATYETGENQFTGMSNEEFQSTMLNAYAPQGQTINLQAYSAASATPVTTTYTACNFTALGKVSIVKNQGACGNCWAFSATGAYESAYFIDKNASILVSEQQLTSCSSTYGNAGCNGGWPANALAYIKAKKIATQAQYPYSTQSMNNDVTGTCNSTAVALGTNTLTSYAATPAGNIASVYTAVCGTGGRPVSVTVDAITWASYKSGIYNGCSTTAITIDHAVLMVGNDASGNIIIKNSWGTTWGMKGYITLAQAHNCGIAIYGVVSVKI